MPAGDGSPTWHETRDARPQRIGANARRLVGEQFASRYEDPTESGFAAHEAIVLDDPVWRGRADDLGVEVELTYRLGVRGALPDTYLNRARGVVPLGIYVTRKPTGGLAPFAVRHPERPELWIVHRRQTVLALRAQAIDDRVTRWDVRRAEHLCERLPALGADVDGMEASLAKLYPVEEATAPPGPTDRETPAAPAAAPAVKRERAVRARYARMRRAYLANHEAHYRRTRKQPTLDDVARWLGVSSRTIDNWRLEQRDLDLLWPPLPPEPPAGASAGKRNL